MSQPTKLRARALGGIFFRASDPAATRAWYQRHLGLQVDSYGTNFAWRHHDQPEQVGHTQWSPFKADTDYFGSADQQFMINYRVDDLDGLLEDLKRDGVVVVGEVQQESYGKFAHIIDNEGRRVELWEPDDAEYQKIVEGQTR
jgi:predicted enzyme related to lactoylglutathione lyase